MPHTNLIHLGFVGWYHSTKNGSEKLQKYRQKCLVFIVSPIIAESQPCNRSLDPGCKSW